MAVIELTQDNFDKIIEANELVVIDFWAQWCQPCMVFADIFEHCANEYPNVVFGKINVEEQTGLAEDFNVRSIPLLMVIKQSVAVFSEAGTMPESTLRDLIEQAQTLDIEQVKDNLSDQGDDQKSR